MVVQAMPRTHGRLHDPVANMINHAKPADLTIRQCEILIECVDWMDLAFVNGWLGWLEGKYLNWTTNLEAAVQEEQEAMNKKRNP
jgi:hypothetical protein